MTIRIPTTVFRDQTSWSYLVVCTIIAICLFIKLNYFGSTSVANVVLISLTAMLMGLFCGRVFSRQITLSEKKYRAVFDSSPEPMWLLEPSSFKFLDVNRAAIEHYGYSKAEFMRMTVFDIKPKEHEAHTREVINMSREERSKLQVITKHRKKSGELISVEITANDLVFNDANVRLIMAHDISGRVQVDEEKERLSQELKKAKDVADRANRAKSEFLANMSHEIRTPLGAMIGFAELAVEPNLDPNEREEFLNTVIRSGKALSAIIDDILDLSKVEAKKLELELIPFELHSHLKDIVSLLNVRALSKGLRLTLVMGTDLPRFVVSDPTRVRQILINLISNAIKFTSEGKIEIAVQTVSTQRNSKVDLQFSVVDSGPGISQAHAKKLFRPFTQADNSTTRKFGGTGLGLALARKLAGALGGTLVLADSAVGAGSTFVFTLPVEISNQISSSPEKPSYAVASSDRALKSVHVLLVEDSADNRNLISRFLKAAGAKVDCEIDGISGYERALKEKFDVVLMDVQMPRLDGFGALEKLRSCGYDRPVIALTAHAMKSDREICLKAGFADHLVKPIDRARLIQVTAAFANA